MTVSLSQHATSLNDGEIVEQSDLGSITRVTADTLPILSGMSIKRIVINPGAMRTPNWHANCNELTYCVSGTSLVSVLDTYSKFSSFTISAGETFHIDSGSLHHIENIGEEPAEFVLVIPQRAARRLRPRSGIRCDDRRGSREHLRPAHGRLRQDSSRHHRQEDGGHFDDPHKFAVEAQSPPVGIAVGSARLARMQFSTPGISKRATSTSSPARTRITSRSSTRPTSTSRSSSTNPPLAISATARRPVPTPARSWPPRSTCTSTTCRISRSPNSIR